MFGFTTRPDNAKPWEWLGAPVTQDGKGYVLQSPAGRGSHGNQRACQKETS